MNKVGSHSEHQCPICSGALEQREVAPCYDCGHEPSELAELARGEHEYFWYSVFGQRLVLCDFCDVDFGSYFPEYFGLPEGPCGGYQDMERHETISNPQPAMDAYCASCQHRRAFLEFLRAARLHNSSKPMKSAETQQKFEEEVAGVGDTKNFRGVNLKSTRLAEYYTKLILVSTAVWVALVLTAPGCRFVGMNLMETAKFVTWGHLSGGLVPSLQYVGLLFVLYGVFRPSRTGLYLGVAGVVIWSGFAWLLSLNLVT